MNLTILRAMLNGSRFALGALVLSFGLVTQVLNAQMLQLNELDYYEKPGVNVLVFSNWYNDNFNDSKISGVELIHHGVRTATNGDVRLLPTPEQWDRIPSFIRREIDPETQKITAWLEYPEFKFSIETVPIEGGFKVSVHLEDALPKAMEGKAGFNLEFLPAAYFGKSYLMDENSGVLPLHPAGSTERLASGYTQPFPLAEGRHLVLAPEDTYRRVQIKSETGSLSLYDGRNKAQNGWLVVRELLPAGQKGKVLEWFVEPAAVENWKREPVISFSQVGYHPTQAKRAVVELDASDELEAEAALFRLLADGSRSLVRSLPVTDWGPYKRYHYGFVDFSDVKLPGLYMLRYGDQEVGPIRVDEAVYAEAWHLTLDVFMPVQMDHMFVREAYRVWHGEAHRDDALQAPTDHMHFDLFGQGPTTDTPFEPFEHIPGLDVGGWFDAGDFDLRTQTHYYTILYLAQACEDFRIERDE